MKNLWYLACIPAFYVPAVLIKGMMWFWGVGGAAPADVIVAAIILGIFSAISVGCVVMVTLEK